jgi:uncharacterized protein (TIGR01319 family)
VTRLVVCADVGSTYTKVALVDLDDGRLVAAAEHPTTVDTDVLDGLDAAVASAFRAAGRPAVDLSTVYVCSSAGGGLRLAVVGYEQLVTAEAGQRVGLTAGARVVHVAAGPLDRSGVAALAATSPDVVLLVGGTDGGEADVLRHNAGVLARSRLGGGRRRVPVVLAGNAEVRDEVAAVLAARGTAVIPTANVLPRIGELNPRPAREAIREVFLRHVIGGKGLSRGPRFARLVRAATPDAVLTGVEVLADHLGGDLVVLDVGGATTDVYSVLSADPDESAPAREVAGPLWHTRTVEGDLGVRWNAPGVVAAARAERLLEAAEERHLDAAAATRAADPGYLPSTDNDQSIDVRLAGLAAVVGLRRHARPGRRDLRRVRLLVGSGGVLRHAPTTARSSVLGAVLTDHAGSWPLPRAAVTVVDRDYVLAPAGLLAAHHRGAAIELLQRHLVRPAGPW